MPLQQVGPGKTAPRAESFRLSVLVLPGPPALLRAYREKESLIFQVLVVAIGDYW